jgi:hypothetical protein
MFDDFYPVRRVGEGIQSQNDECRMKNEKRGAILVNRNSNIK